MCITDYAIACRPCLGFIARKMPPPAASSQPGSHTFMSISDGIPVWRPHRCIHHGKYGSVATTPVLLPW